MAVSESLKFGLWSLESRPSCNVHILHALRPLTLSSPNPRVPTPDSRPML